MPRVASRLAIAMPWLTVGCRDVRGIYAGRLREDAGTALGAQSPAQQAPGKTYSGGSGGASVTAGRAGKGSADALRKAGAGGASSAGRAGDGLLQAGAHSAAGAGAGGTPAQAGEGAAGMARAAADVTIDSCATYRVRCVR